MSLIHLLLWLLAVPIAVLLWATESRQERVRRWRRNGMSYRAIAAKLGVSQTTARRLAAKPNS